MSRLITLPTYEWRDVNAPAQQWTDDAPIETPRWMQSAQEVIVLALIVLTVGLGARICATAAPAWVARGVLTLVIWAAALGALFVGVLVWQSARKTWKRK